MASLFRGISKLFRVGKARYLVGHDLAQNAYYEFPSIHGSSDPRHTRRVIKYREKRELGDYDQRALPVQWVTWLRHTRRTPPTIEELEADLRRQQMTVHNAQILALRDQESRARAEQRRLEEHQQATASQRLQATEHQPMAASTSSPHGRAGAAVPTSNVSDIDADAERTRRVPGGEQERPLDPAEAGEDGSTRASVTSQERMPDNDVWAASKRRIAEQDAQSGQASASQTPISRPADSAPSHTPPSSASSSAAPAGPDTNSPEAVSLERAQTQRAANRAARTQQEAELERARREMRRSPLEAFVPAPAAAPKPSSASRARGQNRQAPPEASRVGRATGPSEEWQPEGWQPSPKRR